MIENCGSIEREIELLEAKEPEKGSLAHNKWEEEMNVLFEKYNKCANFTVYKKLK